MKALRLLFAQALSIKAISFLAIALLSALCIAIVPAANSEPADQNQLATPYTEPDEQVFPGVAAQMVDITCFGSFNGFLFQFNIAAFEGCWAPIYSIHIEYPITNRVSAISCPAGWTVDHSGILQENGSVMFLTQNNPINPGQASGPFTLYSETNHLRISWYPMDADGNLIGKVSMETLTCSTSTEDNSTWGQIKSLYR